GTETLRAFEWHYWRRQADAALTTVPFAGRGGKTARLRTGELPALSSDGARLVLPADGARPGRAGHGWDTGKRAASAPARLGTTGWGEVVWFQLSADGRRVLGTAPDDPQRVHVCDAATGQVVFSVDGQNAGRRFGRDLRTSVYLGPTGERLLVDDRVYDGAG